MKSITVTPQQVAAARIQVDALQSAGIDPDPILVRLSEVPLEVERRPGTNGSSRAAVLGSAFAVRAATEAARHRDENGSGSYGS